MNSPYKKDIYTAIEDEDKEDGNSVLYLGIRFLRLVGKKMEKIEEATENAWINKGDSCMLWLYQLRGFNDLIESQTNLRNSKKKITMFEYKFINEKMRRQNVEVEEKDKYEKYFDEIEKMIERCQMIKESGKEGQLLRYNKDKEALKELSSCTRELFKDANKSHLIMPEGLKDLKEIAKKEWIDRDGKKKF